MTITSTFKYVLKNGQVMIDEMTRYRFTVRKIRKEFEAVVYDFSNFPLKVKAKELYYIHDEHGGVWRI